MGNLLQNDGLPVTQGPKPVNMNTTNKSSEKQLKNKGQIKKEQDVPQNTGR